MYFKDYMKVLQDKVKQLLQGNVFITGSSIFKFKIYHEIM